MTGFSKIQELFNEIDLKQNQVRYLENAVNQFNRVDRVILHYKKTKDIIGNHGYAETDDSFTFDFTSEDPVFDMIKSRLTEKYNAAKAELDILLDKQEKLEKHFEDMM